MTAAGLAGMVDLVRSRPVLLGRTRLVAVDGPAGSGKTTLAEALGDRLGATVLHLDDLYDGWTGLDGVPERLDAQVLTPIGAGRDGRYQRYDWVAGRFADWLDVPVPDVLVVEGCGSGARSVADRVALLVWVEAPRADRLRRGLARDGAHMRGEWLRWMDLEDVHFMREGTRQRADVHIDGTAALAP